MTKVYVSIALLIIIVVGIVLFQPSNTKFSNDIITNTNTMALHITSIFESGGTIPSKYTCDGTNSNPFFKIKGVPEGAQSFAFIIDDPDIPENVKESRGIEVFDHLVLFNIPSNTQEIKEEELIEGFQGVFGKNSAGENTYVGPCPPDKEHRYFFKLYALDTYLELDESATKSDVETAMEGHVLDEALLMGRYERI